MSRVNALIRSVSVKTDEFYVMECNYDSELNQFGNQKIIWKTKFKLKSAHIDYDIVRHKKVEKTIEGDLTTQNLYKLICNYFEIQDMRKLRIKRVINGKEIHLYKIKSYFEDLSLKRTKHHGEIYIQEINDKGEIIVNSGN